MWASHNDCSTIIKIVWDNYIIFGYPMHILNLKLKMLKDELNICKKNVFRNVHDQVFEANSKLDSLQSQTTELGPSEESLNLENQGKIILENDLVMEEAFWQESSRVKWNKEGDTNTTFFHKSATKKHVFEKISSLRIEVEIVTDLDRISNYIINHYTYLFTK